LWKKGIFFSAHVKTPFQPGIKMGLHPNAVGGIIAHAAPHGSMNTTPAEVMAIFRKYLS